MSNTREPLATIFTEERKRLAEYSWVEEIPPEAEYGEQFPLKIDAVNLDAAIEAIDRIEAATRRRRGIKRLVELARVTWRRLLPPRAKREGEPR